MKAFGSLFPVNIRQANNNVTADLSRVRNKLERVSQGCKRALPVCFGFFRMKMKRDEGKERKEGRKRQ